MNVIKVTIFSTC